MRKGAQELKDLDVDRVDGVDRPATGRKFLLFKSENSEAIMKGYAMTATAAANVLKSIRKDEKAVVSRKTAVALNGLAQVLGQDAVFVGKAVPTQPYEFSEPGAEALETRGAADENLGANFTPRSMPGSMVGRVEFRYKQDEDEEMEGKKKSGPQIAKEVDTRLSDGRETADEYESAEGGRKVRNQPGVTKQEPEEDEPKRKQKPEPGKVPPQFRKQKPEEDEEMPEKEKEARGMAKSIEALAKAVAENNTLLKQVMAGPEATEKVEKQAPASRQVSDDEPVRVRKGTGYQPRFGADFSNVVFGR